MSGEAQASGDRAADFFLLRSVASEATAEFTIPPGEYYVGDPCYVLPDRLFRALHEIIFPSGNDDVQTVHVAVAVPGADRREPSGHIVDIRTCHGDGLYPVVPKRPGLNLPARGVGVDSGGIAVVDKRLCDRSKYDEGRLRTLGAVITVTAPTTVLVDDHNLTVVGYLEVVTNEADDEVP